MAKKKPIYDVHCTTSLGIGMQGVKANNKIEAKKKFKKRFPKSQILDIEKNTGAGSSCYLQNAI